MSPAAIACISANCNAISVELSTSRTSSRPVSTCSMNCAFRASVPHIYESNEPFRGVPEQPHLVVLVALPDDASFALGDIRRSPRSVDVMQGDRARLHVRADAHLLS